MTLFPSKQFYFAPPIFLAFLRFVRTPVRESLTADSLQRNVSALRIIDAEYGAVVHAEIELCEVTMQMFLAHMLIGSYQTTLEDREETFKRVGVHVATRPLIFLFVPYLVQIPLERMLQQTGFPGTQQVPAAQAMRSLLALKLFGSARRSRVMSSVFDQGLALFAGLNVTPKRSFLTEYSCRIPPAAYPKLMSRWFDALKILEFQHGVSFDVDFHSIPFHGEDALLQNHYISKRSRRQKGVLAFLAQDADKRVFCYANATVRKENQNDEIMRFVEYWKQRTGHLPEELVFDSKLTTYRNLSRLNELGIPFITLRRRDPKMLQEIHTQPAPAWRRIELESIARAYRTPRILDQTITLRDYDGPIRQITVIDLGHEEPTIVVTNQLRRSAVHLIGRYAQRMLIENGIAGGVDFFHTDALSAAVAMKVSCDLQLTLMASSFYRLLGEKIGNGYATAKSQHIFRDFINAVANVMITEREIQVRFQKRAHNPLGAVNK